MDCIFCKIESGEIKSEKILESENFVVIKDVNPKTKGHSLVIPKKHYETFFNIPENFYEEIMKTTKKATEMLLKENSATGFNIIINNGSSAGQIINHAHLHILPRNENDGFRVNV